MRQRKSSFHRPLRTALAAAAVLALLCTTAIAAWSFLRPSQVAGLRGDWLLSAAFESESAVNINSSVTSGDYIFTLLAVVTGEDITDLPYMSQTVQAERTYAVLAIQRADGTPMPDTKDEAYGALQFMVSPLVKGVEPWLLNAASMHGGYSDSVSDGVMYRLVECDGITMFADQGLYLGVCSDTFINAGTFLFDEETGEISVNPDYAGASAVFELPIDKSLADPEQAGEYLAQLYHPTDADGGASGRTEDEQRILDYSDSIDWDSADPIESTFQELTADAEGYITYEWSLESGSGGSLTLHVESWFEDGRTTVHYIMGEGNPSKTTARAVRFTRTAADTVTAVVVEPPQG